MLPEVLVFRVPIPGQTRVLHKIRHKESSMKSFASLAVLVSLLSAAAFAGTAKSYQVTGPVLEVRPDAFVVQKGKEKWEISRDASQGPEVKVGDKVTIEYTMVTTSVEVKAAPAPKGKGKGKK